MRHQQLLDNYISYVGLTRTPSTQGVHRDKLRPLLKRWDHLEPKEFTRAEFETYLAWGKSTKNWKPRTMQLLLTASRGFIKWADDRDMGIPDFAKGIKKPRVYQGKVIYYTQEELDQLLLAAGRHRIAIPIVLGAYAGMRRAEIYNADWGDIDWTANTITVHGTKTGEDREVPMSPTLQKVVRSHWRGQKKGRLIGDLTESWKSNIRRDLRRLCKMAGVEYKAIHALRRSFATHALLRGGSTQTVMALGGWTNLKTLTRYAGTNRDAKQATVDLLG